METSEATHEPTTSSEYAPKADLGKRFLAHLIDSLVAGVVGALVGLLVPTLGGMVGACYYLFRDGMDFEFMDLRSIGKRVMGLRVVRLDGEMMDLETSMRRNWVFAIGSLVPSAFFFEPIAAVVSIAGSVLFFYEVYRVLNDSAGIRWGDELAGTQVIEEAE